MKSTDSKFDEIKIRDIRCKHIDKKIIVIGKLIQASEVRPQIICASFKCPKCNAVIGMLQTEKYFKEPTKCACGSKENFELINKKMVDAQRIVIGQGKKIYDEFYQSKVEIDRLNVFLREDLCNPEYRILGKIGKRIKATGIINEVPVNLGDGRLSVRLDICLLADKLEFYDEK